MRAPKYQLHFMDDFPRLSLHAQRKKIMDSSEPAELRRSERTVAPKHLCANAMYYSTPDYGQVLLSVISRDPQRHDKSKSRTPSLSSVHL
jgi:hypothetical protein